MRHLDVLEVIGRQPRRLLLVGGAAILALALLATGITLLSPTPVTVTLKAAPLGHISPEGEVQTSVGATLTVIAWSDDADLEAWLTIDGQSVRPTRGDDGRFTYSLAVTGAVGIQASFVQFADNARIIPPGVGANLTSVSPAQDEIIITGASDFVSTLAVDDVLTNTAGTGYDGRLTVQILGIVRDGDRTILRTQSVPFTAAIIKGSIRAEIPLRFTTDPVGRPTSLIGTSVAQADEVVGDGFTLDLERTFRGEGDHADAKAVVHGNVTLNLRLDISIDIAPKTCLCWPPVGGEIHFLEVALAESASAKASLDADAHLRLAQVAQILEHSFPGGFVTAIYIEPEIKLGVGIDVAADGDLAFEASASETLRVGMRFQDGQWAPIKEFIPTATGSTAVGATATARLYPMIQFGVTLEKACTPYLAFQAAFIELQADIGASPWWNLDAGISASAGIDCDLLVTKLQWHLDEQELTRIRISDAGGPLVAAGPTARSSTATSGPLTTPIASGPADPAEPVSAFNDPDSILAALEAAGLCPSLRDESRDMRTVHSRASRVTSRVGNSWLTGTEDSCTA